jgi:hypothetical protein
MMVLVSGVEVCSSNEPIDDGRGPITQRQRLMRSCGMGTLSRLAVDPVPDWGGGHFPISTLSLARNDAKTSNVVARSPELMGSITLKFKTTKQS